MPRLKVFRVLAGLLVFAFLPTVQADTVRVAVASNFLAPLEKLAETFEARTGHRLRVSSGSTGKLYAQIRNGAPFDVFLAANASEPERLEREGFAVSGSRFTYALGRLVLWSADPDRVPADGEKMLRAGGFSRLAIANPKTAPYGAAAVAVLERLGMNEPGRLVRGENVGQAFQYVASGSVELGFVALSQVRASASNGSQWLVPESWYPPIVQQAVLLDRAKGQAPKAFLDFLKSPEVREALQGFGYGTP